METTIEMFDYGERKANEEEQAGELQSNRLSLCDVASSQIR